MKITAIFAALFLPGVGLTAMGMAAEVAADPSRVAHSAVLVLKADPRLNLHVGPERLVMAEGLQPSMICTAQGTLIVQAQLTAKPLPAKRIAYPSAIMTVVSRDGGTTWAEFPRPPGQNGLNFEGGVIQLRSGRILALDTYVTPGAGEGTEAGSFISRMTIGGRCRGRWTTISRSRASTITAPRMTMAGATRRRACTGGCWSCPMATC